MEIKDLINDDYTYKWEVIEKIPEFTTLNNCRQNPRWHSEGDVMQHTKMVCMEARQMVMTGKVFPYKNEQPFHKRLNMIFLAAALFHDIGKGVTTKLGKDGNWHSYGHENEGEKITRYLLWDEDIADRELVCALVRWHMEPLHIFEHKDWVQEIINISYSCMWAMLLDLEECDVKGSIKSEEEEVRSLDNEILENLRETIMNKFGCFLNPCKIPLNRRNIPCERMRAQRDLGNPISVKVLIGLSGAGKSTLIDKINDGNAVVLSRDTIRTELGFCEEGEKVILDASKEKKVSEVFDLRLVQAAKEGKNIIIDNLNLKKKYRDAYKNLLKKFNVVWEYVYVQAPTIEDNLKRREGILDEDIIKGMVFNLDWPMAGEYDNIMFVMSDK
jgi:predicted kinase